MGKFGKIQRINHAVFVNVGLIERFTFAADNNTVGSLNRSFANQHAGKLQSHCIAIVDIAYRFSNIPRFELQRKVRDTIRAVFSAVILLHLILRVGHCTFQFVHCPTALISRVARGGGKRLSPLFTH